MVATHPYRPCCELVIEADKSTAGAILLTAYAKRKCVGLKFVRIAFAHVSGSACQGLA